jgi:enoyl-CoA hydratase
MIVASETAQFGLPEVQRGLIASAGGLMRLPRRLPYHLAMEMALTGDPVSATLAFQHGLVNRLVPQGQALQTALALAQRIARNAPLSLLASKQIIQQSAGWPMERMFELQQPFADQIAASSDAQEGALAFVEKRAPRWRGL